MKRDCLLATLAIRNNAASDVVEGTAEEDVVCCFANDMDLEIDGDVRELEGNVVG